MCSFILNAIIIALACGLTVYIATKNPDSAIASACVLFFFATLCTFPYQTEMYSIYPNAPKQIRDTDNFPYSVGTNYPKVY